MPTTKSLSELPALSRARKSKYMEVTFVLDCPWAATVYLAGDFNDWSPDNLQMRRTGRNDLWKKPLALAPGRYEYKFIVDGNWTHDPQACENTPNLFGSLNSVMGVQI